MQKFIDRYPSIPYIVPFSTFLLLTAVASWNPINLLWLYPIKTILVGMMLLWFRSSYTEIKLRFSMLAVVTGLFVFVIWIIPEGCYPLFSKPKSISPYDLGNSQIVAIIWISFRLLGAALVVPIMEELFWRSFLLRYLINSEFRSVPIGKFTWLSLVVTILLFGVEHNQWVVGIFAGIFYTLLLYRTKSLFACIIAHSITNLALGIYVLITHQWFFW
jgi:CAAX prenyl protease-like protein